MVSQLNSEHISKILINWRAYYSKSKYVQQTKYLIKKFGNGSLRYKAIVNCLIKKKTNNYFKYI